MSLLKLFRHDFRSGILRWRYLLVPLIFSLTCFSALTDIRNIDCVGTWMDYLIACFKGAQPPYGDWESFSFPRLWFLVMAGCLFLNLDYPIHDLTEAGQQVIIRSVNKKLWFLSKCMWNLLSSTVYVLWGMLTALLFALISGGSAGLIHTPEVVMGAFQIYAPEVLPVGQTLFAAAVLPCLTLMALNMLQMALSLVMKPLYSFLVSISVMFFSLFVNSPFFPGNGGMTSRSGVLVNGLQNPVAAVLACVLVIEFSMIIGMLRFERMDHLRYEG